MILLKDVIERQKELVNEAIERTNNINRKSELTLMYNSLDYIKENKRGLYTELMMNSALSSYLKGVDERCNHIVNIIVREMAKENNVNEELKRTDQLKWVELMNNFKNAAEEIVFNEIIYV